MKRTIASVLTALVMALALSGCGSSKEPDTKLTIWTNMSVEAETIQSYADEWGTANGDQVEVIHQSPSVQKFAQAIKSEDGPDAVVGIPNDQLADYVNAGLAAEVPADLYADEDFADAAIQACYVSGVRYAAPLSVETTAPVSYTHLYVLRYGRQEGMARIAQGTVKADADFGEGYWTDHWSYGCLLYTSEELQAVLTDSPDMPSRST